MLQRGLLDNHFSDVVYFNKKDDLKHLLNNNLCCQLLNYE